MYKKTRELYVEVDKRLFEAFEYIEEAWVATCPFVDPRFDRVRSGETYSLCFSWTGESDAPHPDEYKTATEAAKAAIANGWTAYKTAKAAAAAAEKDLQKFVDEFTLD